MGGKEASRGFLYQAFASVLEALCQKNWDKIYIEFESEKDKVDIALEKENRIFKSIQVKSTINTFTKHSLSTWLQDLISDDVGSSEFELFLIGQCDNDAIAFINSIDKFQRNNLDKKSQNSLKGFNTDIIQGRKIKFKCHSFDIDSLEAKVRDSLLKYISNKNKRLTFDQISFIASATVHDQIISSTNGKGIDRDTFDEALEKRIFMVADECSPKRISISVQSFTRGIVILEDATKCLSLMERFEERNLKSEYDWNNDIYPILREFLLENTNDKDAYQIYLDTHLSLAFAAGRVLDSKSGVNIFPMQKTATNGVELWYVKQSAQRNYSNWDISHEIFDKSQLDSVLILNVTHSIYNDVVRYIKEKNLSVRRIINCTPNKVGATNFSIENGNHAADLAHSVCSAIAERSIEERRATLHIFASAPSAFMFFLGRNSRGFGNCVLYEYDYEQRGSCSYSKSISFIK